ncbi:hypothetical protein MG293_009136 [Ovis ammon polii]|uniref:HMG box domain-containing protein n=1 Tax=Ovis ammon polii TaxID=230172 RepID=A0AAD4UAN3_OVIAM|nr:hypothetical protein MG293_009136 [Ovis ammon polii]
MQPRFGCQHTTASIMAGSGALEESLEPQGGLAQEKEKKGEHPGLSVGDVAKKLGEMWNNTAADDKQPYEKKAAKLKEKYEKDIAAYRAKGKPDAAKQGAVKAEKRQEKEGRGGR